ncbi:hypothetical protein GYA27_01460 [candidate division WWE3 bacterium]|uniref:Uncharacterized protein n=1 Tax=candidate division WWE3 bacterium TaxID=2053526 RepID=A0A7X9DJY1_UNCKA|nr:hypothetical protein [candidate division WWE3 bacterium]
MNTHVDIFVCLKGDTQAEQCIAHLQSLGYQGQILEEGQLAPVGAVALYTGGNDNWPSRNFRVASHRLADNEKRPLWSMTTPFLVAIRPMAKGKMLLAAQNVAEMYIKWFKGETGAELPWETRNGQPSSKYDLVEGWLDQVAGVIGADVLQQVLNSQKIDRDRHAGRGGDIVFRVLQTTGKIVLSPDSLATTLPRNEAYFALTGLTKPPVIYGTSDVANLFELLQLLKLAWFLELPAVFETYPGAHNVAHWVNGFLNPSLAVVGTKVWSTDLSDEPNAKFNTVITAEKMKRFIKSGTLEPIADVLMSWAGLPMWRIYQNAMKHATDSLLNALGISVDYRFTTTEDICKATGLWDMPLLELSNTLKSLVDHDVVVYNTKNNIQVKTSSVMPNMTVAELHEKGGWLGGAALYYMVYQLSDFGGAVVMVKDSTRGRVNLIARPFLEKNPHLRLAPVGLFRLTGEEQNEDWSFDPILMMLLIATWGPEKTAECARAIWENMEVPLTEDHIGRKTVATVSNKGVRVRVQDT